MATEYIITVKRKSGTGNVKDLTALITYMVNTLGYTKAKLKLLTLYNIELFIEPKELVKGGLL